MNERLEGRAESKKEGSVDASQVSGSRISKSVFEAGTRRIAVMNPACQAWRANYINSGSMIAGLPGVEVSFKARVSTTMIKEGNSQRQIQGSELAVETKQDCSIGFLSVRILSRVSLAL